MIPWNEIAGRLARQTSDLPIDEQAVSHLTEQNPTRPVLAACSGGADSVFLVLMLLARLPDARQRLHVVHFNHALRGPESDADAGFVESMAACLGLPVTVGRPDQPLGSREAVLRDARYAWLQERYHSLDAAGLCLGHHADDVLESQLMALLSGSGPAGMAAPGPVKVFSDNHVRLRPLLPLKHDDIVAALKAAGAHWQEDSSNADRSLTRNWVRHELIPLIARRFPQNIHAGSAHTRRLMAESVEAFDAALSRLGLDTEHPLVLPVGSMVGQPAAVVRRGFLSWWLRHYAGIRLQKEAVDRLIRLLQTGQSLVPVAVGKESFLQLDDQLRLHFCSIPASAPSPWRSAAAWSWQSGPLYLPGGGSLSGQITQWEPSDSSPWTKADPLRNAWLALDAPVLRVRQWQAGDRYKPLGAPGSRKLQDLFTDAKVNPEQKHQLPVILDVTDTILWVPGFPPNDAFRILPFAKTALKLTYHR